MFTESLLPGILVFEPMVFKDDRGHFFEAYNKKTFSEQGIVAEFVQDNFSLSRKDTIRGLHYQVSPHAQAKLVRVLNGAIYDVVVDIRKDSGSYGKWLGIELSAENKKALYIPEGFAHGFCALSDNAEVFYKCSDFYTPTNERTIDCFDSVIGIDWPVKSDVALMSDKDRQGLALAQAELSF